MAAYFDGQNLPGFGHWLRLQFQEEQAHALKLYDHVLERGGHIELQTIQKPPSKWASNQEAFQQVLEHEQNVTDLIHKLYETALVEKDYPAQVMLQWFINEQVEEEKNATAIVEQLKLIEARYSRADARLPARKTRGRRLKCPGCFTEYTQTPCQTAGSYFTLTVNESIIECTLTLS